MGNRSPEALGDFIRRIRDEKGLSLAAVAKRSDSLGHKITPGYINHIENDPTRQPTANKLKALALGLGIPLEELVARATGGVAPGNKSDELRLVARFRELSPERKADVLKVVDMWHSEGPSRRTSRRRSA